MKKILTLTAMMLVGVLSLCAQHLCLSYDVKVEKNQARVEVYMRSDTAGGSPLASYSTLLHFDGQKAEFNTIDYSADLWDATFADPNPILHYGKGKSRKNVYLQIAAVDMQPSSETQVNTATLLYTITFDAAAGTKLKKGDFYLSFLHKPTADLNYANYAGENFPISTCDYKSEKQREKEEEEVFTLSPNPACGEVNVQLKQQFESQAIYALHDLQGKVVYENKIVPFTDQFTLNVGRLEAGIYFLRIQSGEQSFTEKLVIRSCGTNETGKENTPVGNKKSKS